MDQCFEEKCTVAQPHNFMGVLHGPCPYSVFVFTTCRDRLLRQCRTHFSTADLWFDECLISNTNKKAVLSQRWPRNAPYTWVPWKISGLPDYAHRYCSQHFSWAFVRIDPMNVPTKFEVRSFIRSWDNRGHPKNLGSPWIRPRSLFSKFLIGFYSDWPCKCTRQIWSS